MEMPNKVAYNINEDFSCKKFVFYSTTGFKKCKFRHRITYNLSFLQFYLACFFSRKNFLEAKK